VDLDRQFIAEIDEKDNKKDARLDYLLEARKYSAISLIYYRNKKQSKLGIAPVEQYRGCSDSCCARRPIMKLYIVVPN
jgi:hypothetical protein